MQPSLPTESIRAAALGNAGQLLRGIESMALRKMQSAFVREFVADPHGNATQAAIRAGYGAKRARITACELMKNPEIREQIERQTTRQLENLANKPVTRQTVLSYIVETIERAAGAGAGAWQSAAILKGAELLGRHLGMFTDKIEVGLDAKLMERIDAARKRVGLPPVYEPAAETKHSPTSELSQ